MQHLILFLRWKNLKNRGWSGHLEERDHSVNVRGRQQQYKHNMYVYVYGVRVCMHARVYMCVCVVQLLYKFKQNLLIYHFITPILSSHIHITCVSAGVVGICGLISRAVFLPYQSAAATISEITGGYFSCNSYTHDIGVSPGWMLSRHYPQRLLYHYPAAISAESLASHKKEIDSASHIIQDKPTSVYARWVLLVRDVIREQGLQDN